MAVHRFICNRDNLLQVDNVTVTDVKPTDAFFLKTVDRQGFGTVLLQGDYVGHTDREINIRVLDEGSASIRVSQVGFRGVGTGKLMDLAVDGGIVPQVFEISLADLGTDTTQAITDFFGVQLRAKKDYEGSAGNNIQLTVKTRFIYKDTTFSTLEDLEAGDEERTGFHWNFNAYALVGGELHQDSIRFLIGKDTQIYKQYKKYSSAVPSFAFVPKIQRNIASGAKVTQVIGSYTINVSLGSTIEVYSNIITLYDFLEVIFRKSRLIEVVGVIANDRSPSGMAAMEFPLKTAAYIEAVKTEGSEYVTHLEEVNISPDAYTENVTIECVSLGDGVGNEEWKITSAFLEPFFTKTDVLVEKLRWKFRVPKKIPPKPEKAGEFIVSSIDYVSRKASQAPPPICVDLLTVGAKASSKTITLVYKQKPGPSCACEAVNYAGALSPTCLGLEGKKIETSLDPKLKAKLERIYKFRERFVSGNTYDKGTAGFLIAKVRYMKAEQIVIGQEEVPRILVGLPMG